MSDKEPTVKLFVRVPASFKRRLEMSASAQSTSAAKELVRLLDERLESGLSDTLKRRHDEFQRSSSAYLVGFLKSMLNSYETNLLHCIEEVRLGDTSALDVLCSQISNNQQARKNELRKVEAKMQREALQASHRQAFQDAVEKLNGVSVFDAHGEIKDVQLPVEERRRLNLIAYLATKPRGTKKMLATALGWKSTSRISHILTAKGRQGHRPISAALAESIARILDIDVRVLEKMEPDRQMAELTRSVANLLETLNRLRIHKQ